VSVATTARLDRLSADLADVRRRGLDDIDVDLPSKRKRLTLSILGQLAHAYSLSIGLEGRSRLDEVKQLLWDGLQVYADGHEPNALLIESLLLGGPSTRKRPLRDRPREAPGTLLNEAYLASHLSENQFLIRRKAALRDFASFLDGWAGDLVLPLGEADSHDAASREVAPPPMKRRSPRRWRLGLAMLAGATGLVVTIGFSAGWFRTSNPAQPRQVHGTVTCRSGDSVVGVWIQTRLGSDSGWADTVPISPDSARYEYVLSEGVYALHVGCGGTDKHWASDNRSAFVDGAKHDFVCIDRPAARPHTSYGLCQPG
jgi:hypothetical protein